MSKKQIKVQWPADAASIGVWLVLILAAAFIALSPLLKNSFINWDDNATIFQNPNLSKRLPELVKFYFGPNYVIGNYIPLTMLLHAFEYKIAGLEPHFYHLVNVILHLLNTCLVFLFTYRLSGKRTFVGLFCAAFFAIHPMHVESVAWVAELKDVLYSLFFLMSLCVYLNYLDRLLLAGSIRTSPARLLPVLLLFCLSVLCKPAAVVFPLLMVLIDYYRQRKMNAAAWLEKLPFLFLAVLMSVVALRAQASDELLHHRYNIFQKVLFASHSLINYLVKVFLPHRLSIFHPYPSVAEPLGVWYYVAPFLVLLIFILVLRKRRTQPEFFFGLLFFLVNLLLVLQLVTIGDAVMAERYTYMAYTGVFFTLGMWLQKTFVDKQSTHSSKKPLMIIAVSVIVIVFAVQTHSRTKVWKDDNTVADDLLKKYPDDPLVLNNKGYLLYEQKKYDEAIELLKRSLLKRPAYTRASVNLVNAYLDVNEVEKAGLVVDSALRYSPMNQYLLNQKGLVLMRKQQFREAIPVYMMAIVVGERNIFGYMQLAQCYYSINQLEKSLEVLDKALVLDPRDHVLLNNKGYTLFLLKRYEEARKFFQACLDIRPDYSIAQANLRDCNAALNHPRK